LLPIAEPCNPVQREIIKVRSFAHENVVPAEDTSNLALGLVHARAFGPGSDSAVRRLDGLVEEEWLAHVFYLGNGALEVEGF
jgi:hypothetical protein